MNEFRKAYEYNEETGVSGFLMILFLMLISLEPLLALISVSLIYPRMNAGILGAVFAVAAVVYGLFSLFAGIALKKQAAFAITAVKSFLIFRVIFLIPFTCMIISRQINEIPYLKASPEYAEAKGSLTMSLIIDIAYVIIFSVGWYIYLRRSRRVKEEFLLRKQYLGKHV